MVSIRSVISGELAQKLRDKSSPSMSRVAVIEMTEYVCLTTLVRSCRGQNLERHVALAPSISGKPDSRISPEAKFVNDGIATTTEPVADERWVVVTPCTSFEIFYIRLGIIYLC